MPKNSEIKNNISVLYEKLKENQISYVSVPNFACNMGIDSIKVIMLLFKIVNLYDERFGGCWASNEELSELCFAGTLNKDAISKKLSIIKSIGFTEHDISKIYGMERRIIKPTKKFFET